VRVTVSRQACSSGNDARSCVRTTRPLQQPLHIILAIRSGCTAQVSPPVEGGHRNDVRQAVVRLLFRADRRLVSFGATPMIRWAT